MIAALFDVEGTLYTAQMGRGLIRYARAHGRRDAANSYYLSLVPTFLLRKLGRTSDEALRLKAVGGLAGLLRGWTEEEAAEAFTWVIDDWLLPSARQDVLGTLRGHVQQGDATVLVSGMPVPCLRMLGERLGVTGVVGTELEVQDGRYSGRTAGPVMIGQSKQEHTRRFFDRRSPAIDWAASYAYADAIHDQPLFALVGQPVAVYPDPELRALAQSKGWQIIGAQV